MHTLSYCLVANEPLEDVAEETASLMVHMEEPSAFWDHHNVAEDGDVAVNGALNLLVDVLDLPLMDPKTVENATEVLALFEALKLILWQWADEVSDVVEEGLNVVMSVDLGGEEESVFEEVNPFLLWSFEADAKVSGVHAEVWQDTWDQMIEDLLVFTAQVGFLWHDRWGLRGDWGGQLLGVGHELGGFHEDVLAGAEREEGEEREDGVFVHCFDAIQFVFLIYIVDWWDFDFLKPILLFLLKFCLRRHLIK